ncbi:MAG: hypothetical protein JWM11_2747, partial [Planctomycetaceae bacterium]|nr:hypothetical protein [Planctomycetaceae bacterium]
MNDTSSDGRQITFFRVACRDSTAGLLLAYGVIWTIVCLVLGFKNRNQNFGRLSPLDEALIGVGIISLVCGIWRIVSVLRVLNSGRECPGFVEEVQSVASSKANRFGGFRLSFSYNYEGRKYLSKQSALSISCSQGEPVTVCLHPTNPKVALIREVFISTRKKERLEDSEALDHILAENHFRLAPG